MLAQTTVGDIWAKLGYLNISVDAVLSLVWRILGH
jgi:hypothetical protein